MNKVMKFHSEKYGNLRSRWFKGQVWLYAADVCKSLKLAKVAQALESLDEDERLILESNGRGYCYKVPDGEATRGSAKKLYLVNEAGLYRLIFKSRTAEARDFQRWVFHEVLPSIRRYGYWQETRDNGKATRRNLTDSLAELFIYSTVRDEFHHEESLLFTNYTKLVNKVVGVEAGERDNLPAQKLFEIDQCENICAKVIDECMPAGKTQAEIFEACKEKLNVWKALTE